MANPLDLINDVLSETGYQTLSTLIGNGSNTARRFLAIANRAGQVMARKNWSILLKRNIITSASSAESYVLPSDFDRFIQNTHWNLTNEEPMDGPISVQRWQANKSGVAAITVNDRFQIRADGNQQRYFIDPIPTASEQVSFYYATKNWCRSLAGVRQSEWLADTDVLLLDDLVYGLDLTWRWLKAVRRPYGEEYNEFLRERDMAFARDGDAPTLRILGPVETTPTANIPETGFGT